MRKGLIFYFLIISTVLQAQQSDIDKLLFRANGYFDVENYNKALPLFAEAIEKGEKAPIFMYRTGFCYMQMDETGEKIKSIPYFESAIRSGSEEVPQDIYLELAAMYLLNEAPLKAIDMAERYPERTEEQTRLINMSANARAMMENPRPVTVETFGAPINSEYTEYNPVISADEGIMAYTQLVPDGKIFRENINYVQREQDGTWAFPVPLELNTSGNAGTAGITADGQQLIVFISSGANTGNLYVVSKAALGWKSPVTLGNHVNSKYLESTASITPNEKTIYFASNRPGGYGGMDLYKVEKDENGNWSRPFNLGPEINTEYDDDAPFIHPDQKTLFFTSQGHNSMGGQDIFKAVLVDGKWKTPSNLGYPVNTTADDNYFNLTADGSRGYFSSNRKGGMGGQDIYYFDLPDSEANIPLTMIKGRILTGEDLAPVPTKIKVLDVEQGSKVDYVYNPNPETGEYLIIFPPGKSYDIVIESEGFLPYTININIPNQEYFYELYQQIHLLPIRQFDVVVGQEVEVKNVFYDSRSGNNLSPRMANESRLIAQDSIDVYDIMDGIIATSDTVALAYLLDLMSNVNPIRSVDFDSEDPSIESAGRKFYYDESGEHNLEMKVVGFDTVYTLPTFYVTEEANRKYQYQRSDRSYDPAVLGNSTKVYFEAGQSTLKPSVEKTLDPILSQLTEHPELGIEISGYASAEGDEETNRKLSNERAISVLDYFNQKGVVRRRIIARGYGATKDDKSKKEESRRVEVKLVDLSIQ